MSNEQVSTTSGSADDGLGSKLGAVIVIAVLFVVVNVAAWFFSPKSTVYVLDEVNGKLQSTRDWLYVEDGYLFGMPSMVARWFGWQAPKSVEVHGKKVELTGLIEKAKPELMIVVNRTRSDVFHKPVVYGNSKKIPAYIKLDVTRVPSGQAMALIDAWGFDPYIGCHHKPKARASSTTAKGEYLILAWLTEKHPDQCR